MAPIPGVVGDGLTDVVLDAKIEAADPELIGATLRLKEDEPLGRGRLGEPLKLLAKTLAEMLADTLTKPLDEATKELRLLCDGDRLKDELEDTPIDGKLLATWLSDGLALTELKLLWKLDDDTKTVADGDADVLGETDRLLLDDKLLLDETIALLGTTKRLLADKDGLIDPLDDEETLTDDDTMGIAPDWLGLTLPDDDDDLTDEDEDAAEAMLEAVKGTLGEGLIEPLEELLGDTLDSGRIGEALGDGETEPLIDDDELGETLLDDRELLTIGPGTLGETLGEALRDEDDELLLELGDALEITFGTLADWLGEVLADEDDERDDEELDAANELLGAVKGKLGDGELPEDEPLDGELLLDDEMDEVADPDGV